MAYTAEDFALVERSIDWFSQPPLSEDVKRRSVTVPNGDVDLVLAALRIAAAVMRPDVIERALPSVSDSIWSDEMSKPDLDGVAAAIRKALTDG